MFESIHIHVLATLLNDRHAAAAMSQAPCLWRDSGLADNHVDTDIFLSTLKLKREAPWSYWQVVVSVSAMTRQMSVVGLVSAITWHLYQVGTHTQHVAVNAR
jgi:Phosphatidylinositol N-acetylglucosaminyltransferase